jgi:hypothetical protein
MSPPVSDFILDTASSTDACDRPLTITRALSRAIDIAIAYPIPAVLPVTSDSLLSKLSFMVVLLLCPFQAA